MILEVNLCQGKFAIFIQYIERHLKNQMGNIALLSIYDVNNVQYNE